MKGRSMASEMFGKTYIVKVLDDGECITEGELIRCQDCKYYTGYECQRSKVSNIRVITNEDDYCSRAERKEHETD